MTQWGRTFEEDMQRRIRAQNIILKIMQFWSSITFQNLRPWNFKQLLMSGQPSDHERILQKGLSYNFIDLM